MKVFTFVCAFSLILINIVSSEELSLPMPTDVGQGAYEEIGAIGGENQDLFKKISSFCLTKKGNLYVCDPLAKQIILIDPSGKQLGEISLDFAPVSIYANPDGVIFVAGEGIVAKLDAKGNILKSVNSESLGFPIGVPSGIAANSKDLFVSFGVGWSLRSRSLIVRFDHDLGKFKVIAEDLRGCCQRLDMVVKADALYVAENARHRVVKFDRDGRELDKWGQRDRVGDSAEGFGSCCNPMNLFIGSQGELYTAESGLGRIKRYSTDGEFLGLVGYVDVERFTRASRLAASCSNITVAVTNDESKVFVLDYPKSIIRVLQKKK